MSAIREATITFLPGTEFKEAAEVAYELHNKAGCPVSFSFNGVPVLIGRVS
jgi:hypothetical protein